MDASKPDASIPITPATRLVRRDSPFASRIEDETVIMSLDTDRYYGFGRVGSRIWEMLAEPTDFASLCLRLQQEYKVDDAICREDTRAFLEQLLREKLIERIA